MLERFRLMLLIPILLVLLLGSLASCGAVSSGDTCHMHVKLTNVSNGYQISNVTYRNFQVEGDTTAYKANMENTATPLLKVGQTISFCIGDNDDVSKVDLLTIEEQAP